MPRTTDSSSSPSDASSHADFTIHQVLESAAAVGFRRTTSRALRSSWARIQVFAMTFAVVRYMASAVAPVNGRPRRSSRAGTAVNQPSGATERLDKIEHELRTGARPAMRQRRQIEIHREPTLRHSRGASKRRPRTSACTSTSASSGAAPSGTRWCRIRADGRSATGGGWRFRRRWTRRASTGRRADGRLDDPAQQAAVGNAAQRADDRQVRVLAGACPPAD